ncbi:integral membrane protein GPR155 isoform X1 [Gadus macrocephalus]|uniref:integral membrane protein GPR155 isoform X1 n=1 Tax=Gadus macrocephalus TaxID=80720 RepID=UPI0028CBBFDA|nr:integral membrane protein GPR155 isoform X1 [Gadus macrocephalus]
METTEMSGNSSSGGEDMDPHAAHAMMSINKLFPALLECFGIILCGYIAGRANIITSTQAKGLGNFVSKFALPALLFKNMVELDFGDVIWPFLWSVLIAKVSVFCIVCVLTLFVASPASRFSKAGLYSIFATQSNDFALGYPIVNALYRDTHPEYLQYIYLVAPVSLVLLNPIGFAFCEVQKWKNQGDRQQSKLSIVGQVAFQVLKNPVVFMVFVGIIAHFLLQQRVPAFMVDFVDGLANSFGGAALFYLGLSMVGQLTKLTKSTVVALILLVTAKLLVMPLICKDMVDLLDNTNTSAANHSSLSNYAFIYGVFPSAPSVAIYAAHYNMELEVVTSGMVLSTFLSAPIMYVSAWLLTIPGMDPKLLMESLRNVSFDISIVSLVALVWTIAVMFLSKKYKRLPHMLTVNLLLAQLLTSIGMILWNFAGSSDNFTGKVFTFMLLFTSLNSTYVWPGLIVLCLVLMKRSDELKVYPGLLVIIGWGVPALVTAVLLISGEEGDYTIDPAFFYGRPQLICSAVVLALSLVLVGGALVGLSRGSWEPNYQVLGSDRAAEETASGREPPPPPQGDSSAPVVEAISINTTECHMCECAPVEPMPDMIISTNINDASTTNPGQCGNSCEVQDCLLVEEEEHQLLNLVTDRQVARHSLLSLLLTVSLLANLSSCLWLLFNHVPGRLYLELQFFCAVVNYGQGFISFGLFGLDKHLIILPFKKRWHDLWNRRKREVRVPSELPVDVQMTCLQFVKYHKDQCSQDIVKKRRLAGAGSGRRLTPSWAATWWPGCSRRAWPRTGARPRCTGPDCSRAGSCSTCARTTTSRTATSTTGSQTPPVRGSSSR